MSNKYSSKHPYLFSGVWFGIAALICCSPHAIIFFFDIITRSDAWSQAFNFRLLAFLQLSVIPLIAGFVTGATVGSMILRSNKMSPGKSFLMGGLVTVISICLWGLVGGVLFRLYAYFYPKPVHQDTPGAAIALAEGSFMTIVMLLIILAVIFFGGLAGMSLFNYNSKSHGNGC